MDGGIAKAGMRVMITGDHDGYCWCCTNGRHSSNVREVDMASVSAEVV